MQRVPLRVPDASLYVIPSGLDAWWGSDESVDRSLTDEGGKSDKSSGYRWRRGGGDVDDIGGSVVGIAAAGVGQRWPERRTNNVNAASTNEVNVVGRKASIELSDDPNMPALEDIIYLDDDEDVGVEADMNNLDAFMHVSPIPTTRVHKDHPVEQIIGDLNSATQTRIMTKNLKEHGLFSSFQKRTNHKDFQNCLFACFLSQEEPKKVIHALKDPSWIEAIQEEFLQLKNKKDERGIVIKNKARLVAQGYTQEEGIDYDEVFSSIAIIEAIRLFLAYASFKDFVVYQMDVKSAFLYGKIEEEVYVCQPPGFEDPEFPDRRGKIDKTLFIRRDKGDILLVQVYVDDIIFGSTKKSFCTEFEKMMHMKFQMSSMGELIFFLGLTPMETQKPLLKDEDGEEVDVHLYRSMIGSLMYLTSSRPDIMFAVCACARYQVNPKVSHLHAVKRIFRYIKGQLKLGLWYPKDCLFDLVAYTNSDYARASLDRKSTIGGCQFLRCGLISWQCKKQTVVIYSTTEAEYVAASSCHGQLSLMGYEKVSQKLTFYKAFFSPQWKFLIHTILQCLSAKTTAWNEFSSTMASAIIYLATNQKFVLVFLDKQLDGMSNHKRIYVTPSYTKKIFRNMKRVGKGFSGRVTPLFPTMVVQDQEEMGEDEAINEEMDDSLVRAATTASGLEAEQDSGNIDKTQSKATPNESSSPGTSSCGGPKRQETMGDTIAQTRSENVSRLSNDPLLARGTTLRSGEDRLKLQELMELCTTLQSRVLALENTKTAQAQEITSLKLRVKKLEKKGGSKTYKLKRLYMVCRSARMVSSDEASLGDQEDASKQWRKFDDIDKDAEITLVDETQGRYGDDIMFDVSVAGEEVFVAEQGVPDSKKDDVAQVSTAAKTVSTTSTIPVSAASITDVVLGLVYLKSYIINYGSL
ncbi:putative ribonuclease H-like domain-containing protein [Tanacetum coccineum]